MVLVWHWVLCVVSLVLCSLVPLRYAYLDDVVVVGVVDVDGDIEGAVSVWE